MEQLEKLCKKCNTIKPHNEFYNMKGKPNGHPYCKICFNKLNCDRIKQRKIDIVAKFGNKCHECKNTFHYSVFEFHHLNPAEKDKSIKRLMGRSIKNIDKELKKCIMVCANCHRKIHYDKSYMPVSSNLDQD